MTQESLYQKENIKRLSEFSKLAPDAFKSFAALDGAAVAEGVIPRRTKELIAIAVAHVTGCPYCIDIHVNAAKELDVSKEEVAEAILVATSLKAGSTMAHGVNALQAYDGENGGDLYEASNIDRLGEFATLAPDAFRAFAQLDKEAVKPGEVSGKDKELIAIAVAHVTGCPYCIEIHTANAKKLDVTKAEMAEAILVATSLKAGSAMAHGVNALNAYDA
ncbi:carboxymuconolactone decarboxylase family protein [Lacicoccus alkaliphilus]|uniref:Alkylhydroperoxidase AhpD family core domain-containing protein n=1 Tax=Lacicoccus alkaliphilus DSM 16010 TaxID=1123231 RepID=A0A1M7JKP9_9BACL|nr:carboxymuconolactone decarboxylase family protein [Salinicoccus alkaliphilus]SHM53343.1 alkylhydroperoxidase AhpD family core domain-containing protein [Salinicoccus alkaliphilus DSM 16010]